MYKILSSKVIKDPYFDGEQWIYNSVSCNILRKNDNEAILMSRK